uniref:Uncharacterized protein n=1 Tax=Heliothis virescens TaxID=7102 RepID=A0A2A4IRX5_HELVI
MSGVRARTPSRSSWARRGARGRRARRSRSHTPRSAPRNSLRSSPPASHASHSPDPPACRLANHMLLMVRLVLLLVLQKGQLEKATARSGRRRSDTARRRAVSYSIARENVSSHRAARYLAVPRGRRCQPHGYWSLRVSRMLVAARY